MVVEDFPTPWELLDRNKYDELSKALGMLYTLYLGGHNEHTYYLQVLKSGLEEYYILRIDNEIILNFSFNEVCKASVADGYDVVANYSIHDLKLDRY